MTKLREHLATTGTRQSDLAEKVGVSRPYMSQLVGGTKMPGLELAIKIEAATDGAVTVRSWLKSQRRPTPVHAERSEEDAA
jgi:DNA-binding XRE family transcriptional regulator